MEQAGYQNYYKDVDGALEKTIRYRQLVGLISSSSIRSFREQQTNSGRPKHCSSTSVSENDDDKPATHTSIKEDELTTKNDTAKSKRDKNLIPTSASTVTEEEATSAMNRSSKRKQVPIAVDVIQYMFHNNNHSSIDTLKNSETNSLSMMKLQEKQRTNPTNFKVQHHHPGYIPTTLWQMFSENEEDDNLRFTSRTESEDTINHTVRHERGGKGNATNHGAVQFMPTCFDCGGAIQPGVMNTTIRMVQSNRKVNATAEIAKPAAIDATNEQSQLSRTQRRRESRFKAKLCRKQHYGSKQQQQVQNTNATIPTKKSTYKSLYPHTKSNLWKYIWQQQNKYYHAEPTTAAKHLKSVYPFLNCCSHYYIVTCGSCGVQIILPDFHDTPEQSFHLRHKKKSNARKNQCQRNASVMQNQKSEQGTKDEKRSPLTNNLGGTKSKNVDENQIIRDGTHITEDIEEIKPAVSLLQSNISTTPIELHSSTSGVKRKELEAQHEGTSVALDPATVPPAALSTLLHPQRKKKKTKNAQGKNDLMAFLSSLNDR